MTRTFRIVPAIALAAALLGGAADAQTIKIGVNEPLTGAFAASGTYVVNGAKIAADEINAKGGMLGKKIELVIEDNKSNPTEAAAVAEKLITSDKTPVMMGAWGSSLTLAVMPKLIEYETAMVVETSSSGKITTTGNPYVFRISPPSAVEAAAFKGIVDKLGAEEGRFPRHQQRLGPRHRRGLQQDDEGKGHHGRAGRDHGPGRAGHERAAFQAQGHGFRDHHLTTAVDQLTLIFKQAAALGLKKRIITTGGSQNPDQIIAQAGAAANGTMHLTTFLPWFPDKTPNPEATNYFIAEWKKRGFDFAGCTESFRGYDGIRTMAAAIEKAGKAEPAAIKAALWDINVKGLNGDIVFRKSGPAGKESGQSQPNVYLIEISDGKVGMKTL